MNLTYAQARALGITLPDDLPKSGRSQADRKCKQPACALATASLPTVQTLAIPDWHPVPLNRLVGWHWARIARRKAVDRELIATYCRLQGVTQATMKRRLHLTIILAPRERAADPDAYHKGLNDALVHCGALRGDSHLWVELMPMRFERGVVKGTRIVLEDMRG